MHRILQVEDIRAHFPACSRQYNGYSVAYFDGPGGTQVPSIVAESMNDYLFYHNANTHWAYPSSAETDEALASARNAFADFLNATPDEIAFGANMTTLVFHLARSIGRDLKPGDEIVVTELDHHANIDPWRSLQKDYGITIRMVKMNPDTGQLDWNDFEQSISSQTKLLAIGAASNALGTINNLPKAIQYAHEHGALVFVDAVHYAPHHLIDVRALDCDFLACSAYKFYGPHIGILYGKKQVLDHLDIPKLVPASDHFAERLETGTQNHEGIVGAAAAVDFLANLHPEPNLDRRLRLQLVYDALHERSRKLFATLWDSLKTIPGVTLYGPLPDSLRTPTLSFTIDGITSEEVCSKLAGQGVFLSHGDFYATTVVHRLGLTDSGLIRVGCACYTTLEEINRLVEGVQSIHS